MDFIRDYILTNCFHLYLSSIYMMVGDISLTQWMNSVGSIS